MGPHTPPKSEKYKGAPRSTGKRSTQHTINALWSDPERLREDQEFQQCQASAQVLGDSNSIPILVLEDETADKLLGQTSPA